MSQTILYIEDNPLNMRLVRKLLKSFGYDMIEAIDGASGLDKLHVNQPDLILMDVNLPDVDGLDLTQRIKKMEEFDHIPIIALTANAMHGDRQRCLEAGCQGYLPKPVSRTELRNMVNHFLANENKVVV